MNQNFSNDLNWYAKTMPDNDVIISTRVRFARNLLNFPFPSKYFENDTERIYKIFQEAFNKFDKKNEFNHLNLFTLNPISLGILAEQGYIKKPKVTKDNLLNLNSTDVFINSTGEISANINCGDHIHLSLMSAGLNVAELYKKGAEFDKLLQNYVQFAFKKDFGYLSALILNSGTGLKFSARICIPGIIYLNKNDELKQILNDYRLKLIPFFYDIENFDSKKRKYFTISTYQSLEGSEIDQIANFEAACRHIIDLERNCINNLLENRKTMNRHFVIQSYSLAKFSVFINLPQAIELISDIYFGLKIGILKGISFSDLNRLFYHIQNAHLEFLLKNDDIKLEEDIISNQFLVLDRLRALVFQEAIEKLIIIKI